MRDSIKPRVAIIDYGLGNLFSVKHACEHVGMSAVVTHLKEDILSSDAVILPGVGAFGHAMDALRRLDLISVLREVADSSKPLAGICLGMQLIMTESSEFGHHAGLGLVPGRVIKFEKPIGPRGLLKVPQVCWNQLFRPQKREGDCWRGTLFDGLADGVFMYFIHSFYVQPDDPSVTAAVTCYGNVEFCSALAYRNIFACQCHPERSGLHGMQLYRNLAARLFSGK